MSVDSSKREKTLDEKDHEVSDVAELEGEPLPERAAMSTVSIDPVGEAVGLPVEPPGNHSIDPPPRAEI